jgi:major vault protein
MEHQQMRQERDLVLPPNTFAYVLDRTKGKVSAYVGPFKTSLSDTDHLVVWQGGKFVPTPETERAVQPFIEAAEGQYIVLSNPAIAEGQHIPQTGSMNDSTDLDTGRKVVIPGPANFPLWPGQSAQVIDGHHLRHNQYLVVRVYEARAARENAGSALVATTGGGEGSESDASLPLVTSFSMGQLIVIKGTDVSFYVPSTGIEVVPEDYDQFVREAATLEQLEYAVLLDEVGRKRYEKGPAVVFPEPTEVFATDDEGNRKFRAIELNPQSGLYIKVIAPYEDDDGTEHAEGEEMFLTGLDTPIYFPRVEHSIIQYGDKRKHHAIAVPKGEGRYVLDRTKGEVELVTGPSMFLPDPRKQVIVRRILPPAIVEVMYPGNDEALEVNQTYRAEQEAMTRRAGGLAEEAGGLRGASEYLMTSNVMEDAAISARTPSPRTITLDTKYEGAVTISPWPGYAVLVMDKAGNRRVETGPKNVLLAYDESLMVLSLSKGRPKSDRAKLRTPYLRTVNNSISDQVGVETRDLVPVTLELSYRVNFEGENRTRWFDVEDYVALLTEHCRSKLRNLAKRHDIQEFYTQTIDLVRDTLLGTPSEDESDRPGLPFAENGMRLYDVEVLGVQIEHDSVERLLAGAMDTALKGAIELSQAEQETDRYARLQKLTRERLSEREKTQVSESKANVEGIGRMAGEEAAQAELLTFGREQIRLDHEQQIQFLRERNEAELARVEREVEQMVKRIEAIHPDLVQAINNFGDKAFVEQLVTAIGPVAMATGVTSADAFRQVFEGTPFAGIFDALAERPFAMSSGNGGNGH